MPLHAAFPWTKRTTTVEGLTMAYVDEGEGDAIVFLHGNPTSSYLWRNVMPHLADQGRLIAPDLIGMGDSQKLPDANAESYTFVEHRRYLDGLLDQLDLGDRVTYVIHDWGSALGFDRAYRHQESTLGVAYMEAIVRPMTWEEWPEAATGIFRSFRSEQGENMCLDKNLFVEAVLPGSILRDLTDEEMAVYRAPYLEPGESRRPTLTWPRQIPLDGEPSDVAEIVGAYSEWFATADLPTLLIKANPGAILNGPQLEFCRGWPNQLEVEVAGNHFCQEDSPDEIGQAIADWRRSIA